MQSKGETFVYTVGWIVGGIVVLGIVAAIYFGVTGVNQGEINQLKRYELCVANGGTYIEGTAETAELCINGGVPEVLKEPAGG